MGYSGPITQHPEVRRFVALLPPDTELERLSRAYEAAEAEYLELTRRLSAAQAGKTSLAREDSSPRVLARWSGFTRDLETLPGRIGSARQQVVLTALPMLAYLHGRCYAEAKQAYDEMAPAWKRLGKLNKELQSAEVSTYSMEQQGAAALRTEREQLVATARPLEQRGRQFEDAARFCASWAETRFGAKLSEPHSWNAAAQQAGDRVARQSQPQQQVRALAARP